jgi:cytochrome P450
MTSDTASSARADFDPIDPGFIADPYPTYARMRESCPVARAERFGGYWVISRYADVRDAARDTETFSSHGGIVIPPAGNPMPFIPIELDPPEHSQYRQPLQKWFSATRMLELEDDIRRMVTEQLDAVVDDGQADLCAQIAGPLPPMVIARLLGLDRSDWKLFREMAEKMVEAAETGDQDANVAAGGALLGYLWEQIEARRAEPTDDLLTFMTSLEIDGAPITPDKALGLALFMLLAGHETSVSAIGAMLMHLARDQEAQKRLIAEPKIIPNTVEEILRYDPPIQNLARTVRKDVTVAGVDMVAGDRVLLCWASANRDASQFSDADSLVIDRPNNAHVGFGNGVHRCLGANLARLEMRIILEEVLRRIPGFRIADEDGVVIGGVLARGPRVLPIAW